MTSSASSTRRVLTLLWTYYNVDALRGHRVAQIVKVARSCRVRFSAR